MFSRRLRQLTGLLGLSLLLPASANALITVGAADTPGSAEHVVLVGGLAYVADGYAYVAAGASGLRLIRVADGSAGLRVIDVSDPAAPVEIGSAEWGTAGSPSGARDVFVVGTLAYLADDNWGCG